MTVRRVAASSLIVALVLGWRAVSAEVYKAAETFDAVWTIVRDSHFDPKFDRANWDRVGEELRPRARSARTAGELRAVLADMLGRLGLSHFAVIPSTPDSPGDRTNLSGHPGFDIRLIEKQIVVTDVDRDAAAAGVKRGWIVQSIGGIDTAGMLQTITESTSPQVAQVEAWRLAVTRLRGPASAPVEITFLDGSGAPVKKTITRRFDTGEPVTVGSLPTMYVRVTSSEASTPRGGKAGVIGFNVWMTAVDRDFQIAVDRFRSADGIVIDLRGNPGGLAGMIMGLAGHFLAERATLGVMTTKDTAQPLRFNANPRLVSAAGRRVEPYGGPLAILVDGLTGSASECFSGGMQSLGRARVFGQTSMGRALPALFDKLPNGDVLIHAWGDFVTGTGVRVEGRGVVPDEPVALTRAALLEERDPVLERALAWIDAARTGAAAGRNPRQP
ncbi:MAG TPA: S41 family peptidase [Vicinamibacterales bacterium]|nr:S41 family peptidase [Vicinamibacterales bacterium]